MKNQDIQLIPADLSLAKQATDYYTRNRSFLEAFEPVRDEEFFSLQYQQEVLKREMLEYEEKTAFRFYITPVERPTKIIGIIGLNKEYLNRGYMSMSVAMLIKYAFEELGLHRIEANVMPKNKASLRVLEKNHFVNEGISKYYLNINGVWEDHIHMVKINYAMH